MSDHNVVLTVAAYASEAAARRDFAAVPTRQGHGTLQDVAAAVLHKGSDGALTIDRGDLVEPGVALGGALLGAALTVLAAPVGIVLLPPVVTAQAGWAPVIALVTHFWQDVPQQTLRLMSDMLESNPAGIVIVAVDPTRTASAASSRRRSRRSSPAPRSARRSTPMPTHAVTGYVAAPRRTFSERQRLRERRASSLRIEM